MLGFRIYFGECGQLMFSCVSACLMFGPFGIYSVFFFVGDSFAFGHAHGFDFRGLFGDRE